MLFAADNVADTSCRSRELEKLNQAFSFATTDSLSVQLAQHKALSTTKMLFSILFHTIYTILSHAAVGYKDKSQHCLSTSTLPLTRTDPFRQYAMV
jgi:hypothetical protein